MTFAIVLPFWGCAMNIVAYATLLLNSCMVQNSTDVLRSQTIQGRPSKSETGKSNMINKKVTDVYLSERLEKEVQKEADALWESGVLGADVIEQIGKEHWRTPYLA